jgi:enoyl-CoA hydratase
MSSSVTIPDSIRVTSDGPIRTVTLYRPEHRNAVDHDMHTGLSLVWDMLARDREARAVVLTGAGSSFCAGGDMSLLEYAQADADQRYSLVADARRIATEMAGFPLPVVAAVNGPAVGLGFSLAILSDVVLMSESAFFADPHVSIGLVAADGAALCWPLLASLLKAKEYLLTGDRIDASTAERLGLANRVLAPDAVLPQAHELALRLAGQPTRALRDTKRILNIHLRHALAQTADFAFAAESETFALPEMADRLAVYKRGAGLK